MSFKMPEGRYKAGYVKKKFGNIAEKYDFFNDVVTQGMHRYWKKFLVKKTGLRQGDCALDICCGTGDISRLLCKKTGESGRVYGLDFSARMLSIARFRNQLSCSSFIQADAAILPFKSNSMDAITVGFGLRNLVHIPACLQEVKRVLKPGGRFLSLDMGKVRVPIINRLFAFYFFKIVPRIGKLIYPGEDLFDYFPASSVYFPSQEKLAEMLSGEGFTEVQFYNFYFGSVAILFAVKPT